MGTHSARPVRRAAHLPSCARDRCRRCRNHPALASWTLPSSTGGRFCRLESTLALRPHRISSAVPACVRLVWEEATAGRRERNLVAMGEQASEYSLARPLLGLLRDPARG